MIRRQPFAISRKERAGGRCEKRSTDWKWDDRAERMKASEILAKVNKESTEKVLKVLTEDQIKSLPGNWLASRSRSNTAAGRYR